MVITYQGLESLKIQFGDTVISYNPISKNSKYKAVKFGADIALISTNHPDMNGIEQAERGEKMPFAIEGPGEYEIGGIFIRGFLSKTLYGGREIINTIYLMNLENMNVCFLGPISNASAIESETSEALEDIDILFVPIGGGDVLSASEAYKLSVKLEPAIIIPIHFGENTSSQALKSFLKEGGEEGLKPVEKLTIKKKDLEGKEGDTVVLSPSSI